MNAFPRPLWLVALAVWLTLTTPPPVIAAEIAVTLPPLAGLISMLDQQAKVVCLLGNGSDPHHFQLTPRKIEATQQTKLLIRASKDDAGWPLPPHHAHTLDLWPNIDHGWLNPSAVRAALPLIAKALIDLYPQRESAIKSALSAAVTETHAIELAWQHALAPAQKSGVLMQHPAWLRLMQSMHVPVLEVLESGRHGHQHGPRQLEHALITLNTQPKAWLIADSGHNNRALDWLQSHADHQLRRISLNALGLCSQSWTSLMQYNLDQFGDQFGIDQTTEKQPS
ncbi:MAG: zinc ABC transporter substrate-binding protein [Mariprofundus sp.]|nr:zinc ABC transporter substrate-binding protein [Mariprofundus sp.]